MQTGEVGIEKWQSTEEYCLFLAFVCGDIFRSHFLYFLISNFIDKNLLVRMDRVSDTSLYRTRHIKRNIITSEAKRPLTSNYKKYYSSKPYRSIKNEQPSKNNLTVIAVKNMIYVNEKDNPSSRNIAKFLSSCKVENEREKKIKRVETSRKISLDDEEKMENFIQALMESNQLFHTLERTIVQSIAILSVRSDYESQEKINVPFHRVGFILFGKVKLYNLDYKKILTRGDTIGEHQLLGSKINLKMKFLQPTSILWVTYREYNILKEQSITQGFRQEFNKLDTLLRLSFIQKKFIKKSGDSLSR